MKTYFSTQIITDNLLLLSNIKQISIYEYYVDKNGKGDLHVFIDIPKQMMFVQTSSLNSKEKNILNSNPKGYNSLTKSQFETEISRIKNENDG